MPISHVYEEFSLYNLINNIPEYATEQLGLLFMAGPGLFMLCLGFGIVFSKNSTPKKLAIRGLYMFIIQIVLNIFRFIIPHAYVSNILANSELLKDGIDFFLYSDILPFAGFTFLFFAFVKKFKISNNFVFLFALICTIGQMFIPHINLTNHYLSILSGYFIYYDETSFFPFLSWIIYPVVGYLLGQVLMKTEQKSRFYIQIGVLGLVLFLSANFFLLITNSMKKEYYLFMETGFKMDMWTTFIVMSCILILVALAYFISLLIKSPKLREFITNISTNINSIYCIHWIIVKWLWAFVVISSVTINYNYTFIFGLIIFAVSALLAQLRRTFFTQLKANK